MMWAGVMAASAVMGVPAAFAAAPVRGFVSGPVTSVGAAGFVVKTTISPTGSSRVVVGKKTAIDRQITAARSALVKGACVVATGTRGSGGVVQAASISISRAGSSGCTGGFPGGRSTGNGPPAGQGQAPGQGQRPPGAPPQGYGPPPNFAFAGGQITAVDGSVLQVKSRTGTVKVKVSASTRLSRVIRVGKGAVKVGMCAFASGTSTDRGVTVSAESIRLSEPGPNGCNRGFPGR